MIHICGVSLILTHPTYSLILYNPTKHECFSISITESCSGISGVIVDCVEFCAQNVRQYRASYLFVLNCQVWCASRLFTKPVHIRCGYCVYLGSYRTRDILSTTFVPFSTFIHHLIYISVYLLNLSTLLPIKVSQCGNPNHPTFYVYS